MDQGHSRTRGPGFHSLFSLALWFVRVDSIADTLGGLWRTLQSTVKSEVKLCLLCQEVLRARFCSDSLGLESAKGCRHVLIHTLSISGAEPSLCGTPLAVSASLVPVLKRAVSALWSAFGLTGLLIG